MAAVLGSSQTIFSVGNGHLFRMNNIFLTTPQGESCQRLARRAAECNINDVENRPSARVSVIIDVSSSRRPPSEISAKRLAAKVDFPACDAPQKAKFPPKGVVREAPVNNVSVFVRRLPLGRIRLTQHFGHFRTTILTVQESKLWSIRRDLF